jgi:hypothetical protein
LVLLAKSFYWHFQIPLRVTGYSYRNFRKFPDLEKLVYCNYLRTNKTITHIEHPIFKNMRLTTFIKTIEKGSDPDIMAFVTWVRGRKKFPVSSDPAALCIFLQGKLNEQQSMGYKKVMMFYFVSGEHQLPKRYMDIKVFTEIINRVW